MISELDGMISGLEAAVEEGVKECARLLMEEEAKRTKGQLAKSFITYNEGGIQNVDNTKIYAQWIEFGRGPVHAINAKALRFVINGEVFFRKSVGPAKAQPFMMQAISAAQSSFPKIIEKHINKLAK
jgi:hypothetical protein